MFKAETITNMLSFILFALAILGVLTAFAHSRKSLQKRLSSNLTGGERVLLSIAFAGIFQFLFLMPGWIVAVSILGYSGSTVTPLMNVIFGLVMLTANTVIYFPLFYLLITWFSRRHKKMK